MKTIQGFERATPYARGGSTKMFPKQAAGPAKPAITGKAQTVAPGRKSAVGGPPTRGVSSALPAKAGRTGPRKG
jgi:hypothetical protein